MKEKIKVLSTIHLAITAGLSIAYFMIGDIKTISEFKLSSINSDSLIFLLIPILAIVSSHIIFKQIIGKIDSKLTLEEKIAPYQSASIVRWALLEGAGFILLFIKPDFIIFGLIIIVYLIFIRPTEYSIKNDLM